METGMTVTGSSAMERNEPSNIGNALAVREEAEIKAAFVMAAKYPRDEETAAALLSKACGRPTFADGAMYSFPRGGAKIEGPSVKLAREAARLWGNIRYGHRVVDALGDDWRVEGWALDLQSNVYVSTSVAFRAMVQRKQKGGGPTAWVRPDERDLRELVSKNGAIAERNAVLKILPPYVIDDAVEAIRETSRKVAAGDIKTDKDKTIRRLVATFLDVGVTQPMIEKFLGHPVALASADEIAELRGMYAGLREGAAKPADLFPMDDDAPAAAKAVEKAGAEGALGRIAQGFSAPDKAEQGPA